MTIKRLVRWAAGAALVLFAVASLFLLRHPTILLPYNEFNAKGAGWRAIYDARGDCRNAADEIETYFWFHPELGSSERAILHFHAAQMFAGAGMNARAMPHLDRATNSFMGSDWNDMVNAPESVTILGPTLSYRERTASSERRIEHDGIRSLGHHHARHAGTKREPNRLHCALDPVRPRSQRSQRHANRQ